MSRIKKPSDPASSAFSSLRDAAKAKGPDDRDVEFQRQLARRTHQDSLFSQQSSSKSRILSSLWLDTTHTIIHAYRERLAHMDKAIAANSSSNSSRHHQKASKPDSPPAPGPTARRRLVQKFRSFLTAEESFWSELLARIAFAFNCQDAFPILRILTIPEYSSNDSPKLSTSPSSARELFYRALIYYGDLERYRGVWAENNNPASKNKRPGPSSKKDKKRNLAQLSYHSSRASEAYYQARLLLPDDGNAIHQLAVLSQSHEDTLSSVYWFFRSLSVHKPFSPGKANLHRCLGLSLGRARPKESDENHVELLKHDFIQLLGLVFLHKKFELVPKRIDSVTQTFASVILDRSIMNDVIMKIIVMSISAWWVCKDASSSSSSSSSKHISSKTATGAKATPEKTESEQDDSKKWTSLAFQNMVQIMSTLITSASADDLAVEMDGITTDLGQTVSATLRRCLPCIRVSFQFVTRNADRFVSQQKLMNDIANFTNKILIAFPPEQLASYNKTNYSDVALEENVDLRGFAPIYCSSKKRPDDDQQLSANQTEQKQVHPNEEQLLRITDIINAAKAIASSENSILIYDGSKFSVNFTQDEEQVANSVSDPAINKLPQSPAPVARAIPTAPAAMRNKAPTPKSVVAEGTTKKITAPAPAPIAIAMADENDIFEDKDDPVEMAMRAGTTNILEEEQDEEETDDDDHVLYQATAMPQNMLAMDDATRNHTYPLPRSPTKPSGTASDVLLQLLNGGLGGLGTNDVAMHGNDTPIIDSPPNGVASATRSIWASVPGEPTYNPTSPPFTAPHYSQGAATGTAVGGGTDYPLFPPLSSNQNSRPGSAAIDAYHNLSREASIAAANANMNMNMNVYSPTTISPLGTPFANDNAKNIMVDSFNALPNHTRPFEPPLPSQFNHQYHQYQQHQQHQLPYQQQQQQQQLPPNLPPNVMGTRGTSLPPFGGAMGATTSLPPPGLQGRDPQQMYLDDRMK